MNNTNNFATVNFEEAIDMYPIIDKDAIEEPESVELTDKFSDDNYEYFPFLLEDMEELIKDRDEHISRKHPIRRKKQRVAACRKNSRTKAEKAVHMYRRDDRVFNLITRREVDRKFQNRQLHTVIPETA